MRENPCAVIYDEHPDDIAYTDWPNNAREIWPSLGPSAVKFTQYPLGTLLTWLPDQPIPAGWERWEHSTEERPIIINTGDTDAHLA